MLCYFNKKNPYISVYGRQCVYGTFPSSNIAHSSDGRIALKYDIHEFDGLRIDIIDALHFDHRYGYSVLIDYSTGNATEQCVNKHDTHVISKQVTSVDFTVDIGAIIG